jgi:multidrug efflux pump subunit AcrA (membrane-fusion protein)
MTPDLNSDMTTTSEAVPATEQAGATRPGFPVVVWIILAAAIVLLLGVIWFGIAARSNAERNLEKRTAEAAIPTVSVIYPSPSRLSPEVALPGNTEAFTDTPIYARTSGYLKRWYFDIGARVRRVS